MAQNRLFPGECSQALRKNMRSSVVDQIFHRSQVGQASRGSSNLLPCFLLREGMKPLAVIVDL